MTIHEKLQAQIEKAQKLLKFGKKIKFFSAKLSDNTSVKCSGDLAKGEVLNSVDDGGNESPLPDGSYQFDGGGSVVIKNGVIDTFAAPAESDDSDEPKQQAQAASDKPQADADKDAAKVVKEEEESADPDADPSDDDSISQDDVNTAIAQALAPIIAQLQSISATLTGAVQATAECAKVTKENTEMAKQTQIALSEIGEVVSILADEPAVKKVENSSVSPIRNSESFLERTAHLKRK
jgi:hypothetical protein